MMLFRLLKSSFTDAVAYLSAVAAAVCWLVHAWYPAVLPALFRDTAHLALAVVAALAAGTMMAKYVLIDGCSRSVEEARAKTAARGAVIQQLEATVLEATQERDRMAAREAGLLDKLKRTETNAAETELSSLRRRLRKDAEDRKAALAFLVRELRDQIQELGQVDDRDIAHAAAVLKKETLLLDDEVKKGEKSLYELVLATSQIQKHAYDLSAIRLQTAGAQGDVVRDHDRPGEFPWFSADVDPARVDGVYRFLKVAFHPDRFPSETLKEQAKQHFQQAGKAYSHFKERLRATH
jgi:hypothetical protein